jgi:hypothetical protein
VAVHGAGRRVDVAAYALLAGGNGEALGAVDVHAPRKVWLELAGRVVGDAGKVDDGVDGPEQAPVEAPDVATHDPEHLAEPPCRTPEGVAEVKAIEDRHPVALLEQLRHEDGPDVAGATGNEHVHGAGL